VYSPHIDVEFPFVLLASGPRVHVSCSRKTRSFLLETAQGRARLGRHLVHERSGPVITRLSCTTARGGREMPLPPLL
jgi:hypothetical protein